MSSSHFDLRTAVRSSCPRHQTGGTAIGFLAGLVAGLAVAALVAVFATRAPMPFINKSDRVSAIEIAPRDGVLPDPNARLRPGQSPTAVANNATDAAATATTGATVPVESLPPGSSYMLQAGAYRAEPDAQAMRARLALIGYEAQVRAAKINNETLYRVRIGPFAALDQINSARAKLARDGVEATVVRP